MKDNAAYIDLMIAACQKIVAYTSGVDEERFVKESMVQSAVIMQLQVIGEMGKKLDEASKKGIDVPWEMIIGLRNIISHDYFSLELSGIWGIVSVHIPDLESKLHRYLQDRGLTYLPPFGDTTPLMG